MFGNSSLPPALAARLQGAVDAGLIEANALDPKVLQDLAALPEPLAAVVVDRFLASNLASVRNPSAFLVGVISRCRGEQCTNQSVATRLRQCCIVASAPSTRRQLDGVALWPTAARSGRRGRVLAEKGRRRELSRAPGSPVDLLRHRRDLTHAGASTGRAARSRTTTARTT